MRLRSSALSSSVSCLKVRAAPSTGCALALVWSASAAAQDLIGSPSPIALQTSVVSEPQQAPANAPVDGQSDPGAESGADIVVTGFRQSVASALQAKRADPRITDGISAEDIGKFPSENIAEAIQRVSGVQMQNINGRGSTISIRGLGPQYAYVTVNGQTFKSADFTDGFRFDIIQTDLASAVQVIKSPSATMDAGGLSGTINIDSVRPLDFKERRVVLSAKGQKADYAPGGVTPKISGSYLDQFAGGRLGVVLNASYQRLIDRADYLFMDRWFTTKTTDGTLYTPRRPRYRRIDRDTKRLTLSGGVQYQPTDDLEVVVNAIYAQDRTKYDVNQQVFLFNQATTTALEVKDLTATRVTATNFTMENNRQKEQRNLSSAGYMAVAKWTGPDGLTVKTTANYTAGKSYSSEEAAIVGLRIDSATLDISDPSQVSFSVSNDLTDTAQYDPSLTTRNEYPNGAQTRANTSELSTQVDLNQELNVGPLASIDGGLKFRQEQFVRSVTRRDRGPYGKASASALPTFATASQAVTGFLNGTMNIPDAWVAPDLGAYRDALAAEGAEVPTVLSPEGSYRVDRYVPGGYVMANLATGLFGKAVRGNIGIRYEHTREVVSGYLATPNAAANVSTVTGTYVDAKSYGNWLPSANVTVDVTRSLMLRGALAKVLVRPILDNSTTLAQVSSTTLNSSGTRTTTVNLGQGGLKPLTAQQADISLEWYYGQGNSISIAGFYKDVKNGTYSQFICPATFQGTALSTDSAGDCVDANRNIFDITQTLNDSSSVKIKGYEVAWTQSLDGVLPIKGFGFTVNYTHVDPDYAEGQGFRVRNLSRHTGNATGYWENETFSARVSVNHRSAYDQTSSDSFFAREGHTVRARTQIDLALGFTPIERLSFAAGVVNLNNTREEAYLLTGSRWQETSYFGRSYYFSATTRF